MCPFLGVLGVILGCPKRVWCLVRFRKLSGAPRGPSRVAPGRCLGRPGRNDLENYALFRPPLTPPFFMFFRGFWVPTWSQVGTKMESRIDVSESMKKRIWSKHAGAKMGSGGPSWEQKSI